MLNHLTHINRKSVVKTMNLVFMLTILCLTHSCDKKYINIHDFEYNELRNEKSNADYGKDFNKLDDAEQKVIKDYYPMNISEAVTKAN